MLNGPQRQCLAALVLHAKIDNSFITNNERSKFK